MVHAVRGGGVSVSPPNDSDGEKMSSASVQSDVGHFTTFWGGESVGPSLLRLPSLGFLNVQQSQNASQYPLSSPAASSPGVGGPLGRSSDARLFRNTVAAFERNQMHYIVSPNTYTVQTLMWYADALFSVEGDNVAVSGGGCATTSRREEAEKLLLTIMERVEGDGVLSESVDLLLKQPRGNFPCCASMLAYLRCCLKLRTVSTLNVSQA